MRFLECVKSILQTPMIMHRKIVFFQVSGDFSISRKAPFKGSYVGIVVEQNSRFLPSCPSAPRAPSFSWREEEGNGQGLFIIEDGGKTTSLGDDDEEHIFQISFWVVSVVSSTLLPTVGTTFYAPFVGRLNFFLCVPLPQRLIPQPRSGATSEFH